MMARGIYDNGKLRQFYQILNAFVPGQTYNYSPDLTTGNNPNLTVRVAKISYVVRNSPEEEKTLRYWSKDGIKKIINQLSGETVNDIELIRICYNPEFATTISVEIFPKTFIKSDGKNTFLGWGNGAILSKGKTEKALQAQFLFCNSHGHQGLHIFSALGRNQVELAFPEEEDWKNQRVLIEKQKYPLSQMFAHEKEVSNINVEFTKNPDWRFKPVLSSSKIAFKPIPFFDVFYPQPATYKTVLTYVLTEIEKVNAEELKASKGLIKILANMDESYTLEDIRQSLENSTLKGEERSLAEKIVDAHVKAREEDTKEGYKLNMLENIPPKRKRNSNYHKYLEKFNLAAVSYLEPLGCVEMCVGWITGKADPGVKNSDEARLRPLQVKSDRYNNILLDPLNTDWNVLYDIIDSEGLLLRFKKETTYKARHTFAHLILKVLPDFCGIDEGSLSEQIFKKTNAILLYSKEPGDFKTYGLKHVFDNSLEEVLETAKEFKECPFEESQEGCYYCLHRAVGCEVFNMDLDKSNLDEIFG